MKYDYQTACKMVEEALEHGATWNMAVAFTQETDGDLVKQIVAEQYQQASEGIDDFDMTVTDYLFARLDEEEINMKNAGYFESEAEAEKEGFYWEDEIDRWLKLDVNK